MRCPGFGLVVEAPLLGFGWMTDPQRRAAFQPENKVEAIYVEGEIIGVGGVLPVRSDQTGEAFVLFKAGAPARYPGAILAMRRHFLEVCNAWHRVQAVVNLYASESLRFSKWIGMRPEGIIYESGPEKETFVMFATVKGLDR